MPVSVLSPIARDLALTEGQVGQAISISGIFAVVTSLFITVAIGRSDWRSVLIALTGMMIVSGTTVAFAPNYGTADAARAYAAPSNQSQESGAPVAQGLKTIDGARALRERLQSACELAERSESDEVRRARHRNRCASIPRGHRSIGGG